LGFQDAELSVLVTGDRKMRALNRAYRGMDKTTDVLSFPAMPGEELSALRETPPGTSGGRPPVVLGDIVISAPKAFAQAAERGHPFEEELLFLLAHGLLHLVGYDHETGPADKNRMFKKQRELIRRLEGI
jgi:probable rRNA maturation factor